MPYCNGVTVQGIVLIPCVFFLQEATLHYVLQDASAVNSLTQLTRLTSLSIAGHVCDDAAAVAVTRLTGLRNLHWERSRCMDTQGCVTVSGLLHFTALRALTKLTLKGWRCGRDVGIESSGVGYGAADHSGSITLAVSPDVSAVTPSLLKASTNAVLLLVWRNTLCTPCQADGRAGQIHNIRTQQPILAFACQWQACSSRFLASAISFIALCVLSGCACAG